MEKKKSIFDISKPEWKLFLRQNNMPLFLPKQINEWIYKKSCCRFSEMLNISKINRERLEENFFITPFKAVECLESADENAKKYVFTLLDGAVIEAVVLKESNYHTLCISSQAGCALGCQFCVTGKKRMARNLTFEEILGQFLQVRSEMDKVTHIVFMGMGEPLLNLNNVLKAIAYFTDEHKFNLSKRKIVVSTSGILAGIQELMDKKLVLNLALSVGNPNPYKRQMIMPVEKKNPIIEVTRLLYQYNKLHNRKITLEYTLLKGVNDGPDEVLELSNMAKYLNAKINLINLNPHKSIPFSPLSSKEMKLFAVYLENQGVSVTTRFKKGQDIAAACGQLGE